MLGTAHSIKLTSTLHPLRLPCWDRAARICQSEVPPTLIRGVPGAAFWKSLDHTLSLPSYPSFPLASRHNVRVLNQLWFRSRLGLTRTRSWPRSEHPAGPPSSGAHTSRLPHPHSLPAIRSSRLATICRCDAGLRPNLLDPPANQVDIASAGDWSVDQQVLDGYWAPGPRSPRSPIPPSPLSVQSVL